MATDEEDLGFEHPIIVDARKALKGRKITDVRLLTAAEADALGWVAGAAVIVLDDGMMLWASSDDEGNGPGAIFGHAKGGGNFGIPQFGM